MTSYKTSSDVELVESWRRGEDGAATELHCRYVTKLIQLIGGKISPRLNSRVAADDVVQSVFRTLFERVRRGEFRFDADEDFWRLLVTIALNKWRKVIRFHKSECRSLDKEDASLDAKGTDALLASRIVERTTIAESVIFADLLERLLGMLEDDEQRYLMLRLRGDLTQKDIGDEMGVSDRTVRRIAQRIQERVAEFTEEDGLECF